MTIQKIQERKRLFRWANKQTQGNVEFFYVSFYDGLNKLELKPSLLRYKRILFFENSTTNPKNFCRFFNLAEPAEPIKYCDVIINSLFANPIILEDFDSSHMQATNSHIDGAPKDLDFSLNDIFFKIDKISYEKDSIKNITKIIKIDSSYFPKELNQIKNFCQVEGFKFLMSNRLKNVVTSLLKSPFDHFKKINENKKAEKVTTVEEVKEINTMSPNIKKNVKFLFSEWQQDDQQAIRQDTRKTHIFAFLIDRPEFNIYDDSSETQVLFASEDRSLCLVSKELLEYDAFEQDPKFNINFIFNGLQLFTGILISSFPYRLSQTMLLAGRQ